MKDWIKYVKRNCNNCNIEYEYDSRQKNPKYCSNKCRGIFKRQSKIIGDIGIDYVICKICSLKFKEINNDHLSEHNINSLEYDKIYGNGLRTSSITSKRKNTIGIIMNNEFSKKLSDSHKIENYIKKYGKVDGPIKYNNMIKNKTYKNSVDSYIDKYGESGYDIFNEVQLKKVISLKNQIKKHGNIEGEIKYKNWLYKQKFKSTIYYFIDKYGELEGIEKWMIKNNNISVANSKILKSEKSDFSKYILDVNKFTRISISIHDLLNINLRGRENGYDLDHRVSKIYGFKNKIPAYIIGHISNLNIVTISYNRKKQHRSDIDLNIVKDRFEIDIEYKKIIEKIII